MIGNINATTQVSQVSQTKNSLSYEQEVSKVDYSNYSLSNLREIPYEEAKANIEDIKQRQNELIENGALENELKGTNIALTMQLSKLNYSDNDKFNKALYESVQTIKDPAKAMMFDLEISVNMNDYYYGKDTYASFVVGNDEIHSYKESLTKTQISSINFDAFIDSMLKTFTENYNNTSSSVKDQYKELVDNYTTLKDNYQSSIREPYYV